MPKKMDEVFGLQEVREQRMPLFKVSASYHTTYHTINL